MVTAWVGFALFIIVCSTLVALHADRLAHRHAQKIRTDYFEHVLQLPLSYHTGTHSGRLMKVMITGTNTLWSLWLAFFRQHLASFVSLLILMPLTLFLNWRFGVLLMILCAIFGILIAVVLYRSEKLQSTVERYYTDMAERTTDTFGNIALIQSFARVEAEVMEMKEVGDQLLGAQMPVLSWWALATVLTRASTTLTMLAMLIVGIFLYLAGETTVGEIVMFMSFATMLIGKLEQAVHFANQMVMDAPRVAEFFEIWDTEPNVRDRSDAIDPGRLHGLVEFKDVSFSYDGKRPAVRDLSFTALPGETIALVGATGAGKSTALALLHRVFDPQSGAVKIDGMDIRGAHLVGAAAQYRGRLPGSAAVQPFDQGKPAGRQAGRHRGGDARSLRARAGARHHRESGGLQCHRRRKRQAALRRRTSAALDRSRAAQESADPDFGRSDQRS